MQEQGISLDEVDPDGNSAVHIAAQQGYLGCIQVKKKIYIYFKELFELNRQNKNVIIRQAPEQFRAFIQYDLKLI